VAIVGALVFAAGIIAYFAMRKGDSPKPSEAATGETPTETPAETPQPAESPEAPTQAAGPDPTAVAASLERALKKERLWSTVSIVGDHVDVRSGSCNDKGMAPLLDGAAPSFKAAGLTRIRCLEQSGQVVTERGL
jgi:hypothetical protein